MVCACWFTLLASLVALYYIIRYILELFKISDLEKKVVFVSGCDSGFGRLLALRCARNGVPVYAACLTKQGEESLKQEKEFETGLVRLLSVDVTKADSVKAAAEFVKKDLKEGESMWALVNNAGVFSIFGPDDWLEPEDYLEAFEVNCLGGIRLVHALRALVKKSRGRIISTSSICGRVTSPMSGPYSVAKYGVESFMDCIRQELSWFGVSVHLIEPAGFRTGLLDDAAHKRRVDKVWGRLSEERRAEYGEEYKESFIRGWNKAMEENGNTNLELVVDAYWHAITARFPRARYAVGWQALLFYIPMSFVPTWFQDFVFAKLNERYGDIPPAGAIVGVKPKTN